MKIHKLTFWLLVIGGLNWLLVGLFGWDISRFIGGPTALVSKIIYILVGISAIIELFSHKNTCSDCAVKSTPPQM